MVNLSKTILASQNKNVYIKKNYKFKSKIQLKCFFPQPNFYDSNI